MDPPPTGALLLQPNGPEHLHRARHDQGGVFQGFFRLRVWNPKPRGFKAVGLQDVGSRACGLNLQGAGLRGGRLGSFRKLGVPYLGGLIVRILLFRVLPGFGVPYLNTFFGTCSLKEP